MGGPGTDDPRIEHVTGIDTRPPVRELIQAKVLDNLVAREGAWR